MQSVFKKHQDATLFCPHYSWEATNGSVESQWNNSHHLLEPGFSSATGRLDRPDSCGRCGSREGPGEWVPLQDVSDSDFWCWAVSLCGDCLVSRWWWHVAWSSEWLIQPHPDRLPDIRLVQNLAAACLSQKGREFFDTFPVVSPSLGNTYSLEHARGLQMVWWLRALFVSFGGTFILCAIDCLQEDV